MTAAALGAWGGEVIEDEDVVASAPLELIETLSSSMISPIR